MSLYILELYIRKDGILIALRQNTRTGNDTHFKKGFVRRKEYSGTRDLYLNIRLLRRYFCNGICTQK